MKFKKFLKKYITPIILFAFFLIPFVGIAINDWLGWDIGNIYTLGLPLKDFFSVWITVFGVIGLIINISINNNRLVNQQQQINLQSKSERNNRFQKAIELLGNLHESARIGGIQSLFHLGMEYPAEFKELVFNVLCSHIRTSTNNPTYKNIYSNKPSNEIITLINILFKKREKNEFSFKEFKADLNGSYLQGLELRNAEINNANLEHVNFNSSSFYKTDFINSKFNRNDFSSSKLQKCDFSSSILSNVNLTFTHCNKVNFNDSFIEQTRVSGSQYSSSFIGTNILNCHIGMTELYQCKLLGTNISGGTTFFKSLFEETQIHSSLLENLKIWNCVIKSTLFDGSYLRNVCFKGCGIQSSSIRSGGFYKIGIPTINKFYADKTQIITSLQNKRCSLYPPMITYGTLTKEIIDSFDNERGHAIPTDVNLLQNQTESKVSDFETGKIDNTLTLDVVKRIKEAEKKCGGWRQNRN
ncbi:MAG: pentapeptide repeat-containing protein [Carboxylicivirga sp.]|jgi:uncharacterized protein YjbI with pentapeptide repeats|nr:pentapeptide repeat-containing protein [Carboxylicivirga sp.]